MTENITVEYLNVVGNYQKLDAEGMMSICLQHEIDHLHGKVFLDRMTDFSQLAYVEEFEEYIANKETVEPESI